MAEVIRYMNLASTPGGDGTTNNTTGATRAYASFSEWAAAEQTDLPLAGDWHHLYYSGVGELVDNFTIAGWTTNATGNNIVIEPLTGPNGDGTPQSGLYIKKSMGFSPLVQIDQVGTVLVGIDVENTSGSGRGFTSTLGVVSGLILLVGCKAKALTNAYSFTGGSVDLHIIDSLAYDSPVGVKTQNHQNCGLFGLTVIDCPTGIIKNATSGGGRITAKNVVVFGSTTPYATPLASHFNTVDSTNNATDDTVTTNVPGSNPIANIVSGDFTNHAGNDWSLASGSNLVDAGADLATAYTALNITNYTLAKADMIGTSRPQGSGWDVGAFELAGGTGATFTASGAGAFSVDGKSIAMSSVTAPGVGTDSFVSSAVSKSGFGWVGDGTTSFDSKLLAKADFTAVGSGDASFDTGLDGASIFTADGVGGTSFDSGAIIISSFDFSGAGSAALDSKSIHSSLFAAPGVGSATLDSNAIKSSPLSADGFGATAFTSRTMGGNGFVADGVGSAVFDSRLIAKSLFALDGEGVGDFASAAINKSSFNAQGLGNTSLNGATQIKTYFNFTGTSSESLNARSIAHTDFMFAGSGATSIASTVAGVEPTISSITLSMSVIDQSISMST